MTLTTIYDIGWWDGWPLLEDAIIATGMFFSGQDYQGNTFGYYTTVSTSGIISSSISIPVGTSASVGCSGCSYGVDKGIFAYGAIPVAVYKTRSVLVSNTGTLSADVTGVGNARTHGSSVSYGGDKGIFIYGKDDAVGALKISNKVSNTGVISDDVTESGNNRVDAAACRYGYNKGLIAYGTSTYLTPSTSLQSATYISDTGTVTVDQTIAGTKRYTLAGASYGINSDKGILYNGYVSPSYTNAYNLISNTGVVASDSTGVGTARGGLMGVSYGIDTAVFMGGGGNSTNNTNKVSNTGIVSSDETVANTCSRFGATSTFGS